MRRTNRLGLLLVALLALSTFGALACESSVDNVDVVAGVSNVEVRDNKFESRAIEVAPGTTVTWTFSGDREHNVRGDGWGSETMEDGEFQHRFAAAGTYDYLCTLHGGMTGRVIVR